MSSTRDPPDPIPVLHMCLKELLGEIGRSASLEVDEVSVGALLPHSIMSKATCVPIAVYYELVTQKTPCT